jgi:hypothetical protein
MTSTARLQRDADAARVGLADTLGQLRDGMAPTALSGEALALVKDTGLSLIKSLAEQARANPVPALLIGAGLTMLLTKTTGGDVMSAAGSALKTAATTGADAARGAAGAAGSAVKSAASSAAGAASAAASAAAGATSSAAQAAGDAVLDTADRAATSIGQTVDSVRRRVAGGVESAGEGVSERYSAAREKVQETVDQGRRALHDREDQARGLAHEAQDRAKSMAEETRQSVAKLLEEQPILMAALGAALGAAIGAALPLSKQEKDMLGGVGSTAVNAGRDALSSATDVLRKEVANADLGSRVGELADKLVAGAVGGAAKT